MIYLDNAATTRPLQEAFSKAAELACHNFFNPSALYRGGISMRGELERARASILSRIAGEKYELIFTSGGTEADDQAIFGGARRGNAVTTLGEHAAVFRSFQELKNRGVETRFAPLNRDGSVDEDALLNLVDEKTSLVSVMHVNNETGAVNDIQTISKKVKEKNPRCLFHSDGVQAFGKLNERLGTCVDLYSVSAHKIGGIKGTGALIKKKDVNLPPLIFGGGQEGDKRSGTENVLGILCFAYAAEIVFKELPANFERVKEIKKAFADALDPRYFALISTMDGYLLSVSARGLKGEIMQRLLEEKGILVGTGSACSSKKPHSRVIEACGYQNEVLDGVLRVSFSFETTKDEALTAANAMNECAGALHERISRG